MPDFDVLVMLAKGQHRAGRLADAAATYRQILALRPDAAEIHQYLGDALLGQGLHQPALAEYETATALNPKLVHAQNNLGNLFRQAGRLDEAAARYQQVLALRPDLAEPHNNLGNVLLEQGRTDEAAARFSQASALRPDLAEPHNNLGNVLRAQGQSAAAAARYRRAIALRPNYAEALNNLGNIHWEQGQFEEAAALFRSALSFNPELAQARFHLSEIHQFAAGDPELAALERMAAEPGRRSPADRIYVHFALGKACEDAGQYARAFDEWQQGNAQKRAQIEYDAAAELERLPLIAARFDRALFDRLAEAGDPSSLPIFIVGMPRSGSTLVEQILAGHGQVHAGGELTNLDRLVRAVRDGAGRPIPFPAWAEALDARAVRQLGQTYLASLPPLPPGKTRITDKLPTNFLYIGLIHLILPQARILHTVRDPIDTCLSCYTRLFQDGVPYGYDLAELGGYYRAYRELMDYWHRVLPAGTLLDVRYEDVVDDLEAQVRRLLEFCGLPWDDRCLKFHEVRRPVATSSNVQVSRPLYRSSVERWRRYEPFLGPLLEALGSRR